MVFNHPHFSGSSPCELGRSVGNDRTLKLRADDAFRASITIAALSVDLFGVAATVYTPALSFQSLGFAIYPVN